MDDTRPQELLGVVEVNCGEPNESVRDDTESYCGSTEKVLSELILITLFRRQEDGGRGDEARLDALTLSADAVVRLDEGRLKPETPALVHGSWSLSGM